MSTQLLTIALAAWSGAAAVILVAGMWLLLAGRLNAGRREYQQVSGVVLAARWALFAAGWPVVPLGCVVAGVRSRVRDSARRLVAAGRDGAVITDVQKQRQLEKGSPAMRQDPRGRVDHGVPQTAPFWVGQRIQNAHADSGW